MTTVTIQKWGNSQGIRLSKETLAILGAREGDTLQFIPNKNSGAIEVVPSITQDRLTIPDLTIEEIFKDFDGVYTTETVDWGKPVGKEIW